MKVVLTLFILTLTFSAATFASEAAEEKSPSWTLITATPDEGFQLAIETDFRELLTGWAGLSLLCSHF